MKKMTDEEAEYWDDCYTNNTIMPDMSKPGFFARKYGMMVRLDPETIQFLAAQAETSHKSFTQIINELVKEKIAVSI
jgi:predicted HicB family RNase H-like nuclease